MGYIRPHYGLLGERTVKKVSRKYLELSPLHAPAR
jgi:hypothetical protein